eukprot:6206025-Pleurochrysis_carterae.AAC.1
MKSKPPQIPEPPRRYTCGVHASSQNEPKHSSIPYCGACVRRVHIPLYGPCAHAQVDMGGNV